MLFAQHTFGRNYELLNTKIPFRDVSNAHATIRYENNTWVLTDHSRNGTLVGNRFLCKDSIRLTKTGTVIQFGSNESTKWKVIDLDPPASFLKSNEGEFVELEDFHPFYDQELPKCVIFRTHFDEWVYEYMDDAELLNNGKEISIFNKPWTFFYNDLQDETSVNQNTKKSLDQYCFEFNVSNDEENVSLNISGNEATVSIEERAHHYLILTLARIRLSDHLSGVPEDKQGWVTLAKLEKMLLLSKEHLNIQIFRFRQQLSKLFSHHFSNIVERKSGEIRFGFNHIKILKDHKLEGQILANSV